MFKIKLRKSIGLDEDIVEGKCLVSLVVIKAQKIAPLSLYLCRKDAIFLIFVLYSYFLILLLSCILYPIILVTVY
ncbi:hypothetical protein FYM13_08720 [Staphylococcus aureus]|nr:hypothetical protein FYM10_11560 [Staphylococcus aureus]TYN88862.1 hypothetical protein FYM11_13105 [Staphylococcus aureus]TYN96288.1 hypothetical protein FYM19_11915 [Staphylococcus aureus]TYN99422.1 hypothetical protein FYM13_08720 [Staphylococcus aureus]TYO04237.1 hypothetical protein FYM33_06105 [Staphylococcus aureus]